jgi:hypothetical protein
MTDGSVMVPKSALKQVTDARRQETHARRTNFVTKTPITAIQSATKSAQLTPIATTERSATALKFAILIAAAV